MLVELRIYQLRVGCLEKYLSRYRTVGFALQSSHLGEPVGWYTVDVGPLNQVVSLWQYADHEDRAKKRASLAANPEWRAFLEDITPFFETMENRFLTPAAFNTAPSAAQKC
jgi:hypothetical protein